MGTNYLDVCATGTEGANGSAPGTPAPTIATTDERGTPMSAARGIRAVLGGELPHFTLEYPCHSPTEQRWFVMNVAPIRHPGLGAVVSHVNITAWRGQLG